jgi:glycosyltransferase involved in cell wall biosynthesis
LQRASALCAISEHTAKDMIAIYPELAAKISVTQLGVDDFFFEAGDTAKSSSRPYLLYVGHRTPYKNFIQLLAAFGESGLSKQFDLRVISPGKSLYSQEERDLINRHRLNEGIQLLSSPSDSVLRDTYAGAFAFVYPSLYEGFGLPVLEALACGTLVAASNTSSMPEVGGEVALYFDPHHTESIAECLRHIADLPTEERAYRIEQGIARARTFTWERCQRQTVQVLNTLAAGD